MKVSGRLYQPNGSIDHPSDPSTNTTIPKPAIAAAASPIQPPQPSVTAAHTEKCDQEMDGLFFLLANGRPFFNFFFLDVPQCEDEAMNEGKLQFLSCVAFLLVLTKMTMTIRLPVRSVWLPPVRQP